MELRKLLKKRENLLLLYCSFPVGTLDWERCRYELDVIDAQIICTFEFDPEQLDVDGMMEEIFGFTRKNVG